MDDIQDVPTPEDTSFLQEAASTIQAGVNAAENVAAARIGSIQMISVQSSDIAAYGYDPIESRLQVQYTNNRVYVFENISPLDFEGLSNAPSKGKYIWTFRRNPLGHPFTRLA